MSNKTKTKIFYFGNSFSYMANACVRESMRTRDMHEARHVIINAEICMFLLNVCGCVNMALHVHLGGE